MSIRRKILLFGIAALVLPFVELALSGLGVSLSVRVLVVLLAVAGIVWAAVGECQRVLADLSALRKAIDDTAQGEFTSDIKVSRPDELGALADAVRTMRERLTDMSLQLVQSLRIESLNILGSILVHDMKNLSFRLRFLGHNLTTHYGDPAFRESLARALDDTTEKMDRMARRFREQKEKIAVKIRADVNDVTRSALRSVRRDGAAIHISEQYGDLPLVWIDPMLMESALFNILDNARDAMPQGGQIAVRTRLDEKSANSTRRAVIEIADTGSGMSEEFIRNGLFAPFITTKPGGLGLGLYTCRQIITLHDGEIRVRSRPGQGTLFGIYLPITD